MFLFIGIKTLLYHIKKLFYWPTEIHCDTLYLMRRMIIIQLHQLALPKFTAELDQEVICCCSIFLDDRFPTTGLEMVSGCCAIVSKVCR